MTQFLNHFAARHHFHYTEMSEVYISLSLRALALGIGGLFVPLFLYDIGFGLAMIAVFFISAMALRVPAELVAAWMVSRAGIKHTMTASFGFLFCYFVMLYLLPHAGWLWPVAALFLAMDMALFWASYHLRVSEVRSHGKASTQVGITVILRRLSMALGPLAGGFLAAAYGVEYTLLAAAVCLLLAAYPLLKTPDVREKFEISWNHFRVSPLERDSLAHISYQIAETVAVFCWPIWLLLVLGSYSQIGMVVALSIVLGIGLTFWVGRLGDRGLNTKLLKVGSAIKMVSHGARVVSTSFGAALFANLLNDLGENFTAGPFQEKFYEAADRGKRFAYILRINIISALGKMLLWAFLLAGLLVFQLPELLALQSVFVLAALAAPFMLWVSRRPAEPEPAQPGLKTLEPAPETVPAYEQAGSDVSSKS